MNLYISTIFLPEFNRNLIVCLPKCSNTKLFKRNWARNWRGNFPAQLLQGMTKSQAKRTLENALRKWEKSILLGMLQVEYSQVRNGVETAIMNHQLETFRNIIKLGSNL